MPLDCLRAPWLADWVAAVAEATQTPPDLAAMLGLAICGAALAGRFRVLVRKGWSEPTNIFTATALSVGERKSTVFRAALEPVQALEAEERARLAPAIAEAESERRMLEGRLKNAEAKVAKVGTAIEAEGLRSEAKDLARQLAAFEVPEEPHFYCDDVTAEKLSNLLARQGGRILQASAEGTAFEIAKGRYSESANFDAYLKGHSGDPLRVGRIGRDGDTVDSPALSVALAVQPDVVAGLAEQASLRGRGFLARFLYSLPPSLVGSRTIRPAPVPFPVTSDYRDGIRWLWERRGGVSEQGRPAPHLIEFSPQADDALATFETWLEPQLADGDELSHLGGWANKLPGAVARLAGILHATELAGAHEPHARPVAGDTCCAAIVLARDYLLPHARAAFSLLGADDRITEARRVMSWLVKEHSVNSVNSVKGGPRFCETVNSVSKNQILISKREIHTGVWGGSKKVEDVEPVLDLLVKHGYLRHALDNQKRSGPGRHPSPRFEVNPEGLAQFQEGAPLSHISQNSRNGTREGS